MSGCRFSPAKIDKRQPEIRLRLQAKVLVIDVFESKFDGQHLRKSGYKGNRHLISSYDIDVGTFDFEQSLENESVFRVM